MLTLNLSTTFTAAFAGAKQIWAIADSGVLNSGWSQQPSAWTVTTAANSLPAGWSLTMLGSDTGAAPTYSQATGTFTVNSANNPAQEGGTADGGQFVNRTLTGDSTIIAHPTGLAYSPTTQGWGIAMRAGPSPSAASAILALGVPSCCTWKLQFIQRTATGNNSTVLTVNWTSNSWLKLTKNGAVISAYLSPDGVTWNLVGSMTLANNYTMMYGGLIVDAGTCCGSTWGTFDHVTVTTP